MPCYRITLAYDGTDFEGWQLQRPLHRPTPRTVQGVLEEGLAHLADGERVAVVAAGRTDAGVHATGQVVSFALARVVDPDTLVRAVNGLLPSDVRVLAATETTADFDARRRATGKLYRYDLDLGPIRLPTRHRWAGFHRGSLDEARVAAAAALYVGRQDFAALASAGSDVKTTVRTVSQSSVRFEEEPATGNPAGRLVYEVVADGFLRKMVRSMVGGLIAAGSGTRDIDDLREALLSGDRRRWPAPAEACGLTLLRVFYP
jgi:tRNA pseudouridine38-40 synthase